MIGLLISHEFSPEGIDQPHTMSVIGGGLLKLWREIMRLAYMQTDVGKLREEGGEQFRMNNYD